MPASGPTALLEGTLVTPRATHDSGEALHPLADGRLDRGHAPLQSGNQLLLPALEHRGHVLEPRLDLASAALAELDEPFGEQALGLPGERLDRAVELA